MRVKRSFVISALTFCLKYPKAFLVAFLLGGLSYSYEVFIARDTMSFQGIPTAATQNASYTRIFRNRAYMVGYSDLKGNPLWVVYQLTLAKENAPHLKRPDGFHADWRNVGLITSSDYTNSGYDRGHMAPNHAISILYGKEAQYETFLMTNITPQKPSLNQKLWQQLEEKELEMFAPKFKALWIYTGPLFDAKVTRLKSSYFVEIPDAFYKMYVGIEEDGTLRALAFILPQNAKATDRLEKYAVSIDEVERRSGFDFLHELEDEIEEALEKKVDVKAWF
ncbi:DNA/RNA non-specific endonuclease [Sulfurospirillum multivorans]|uniref:Nuclease n=2 Tax=Sulfurospirillum multivorans TaxID=66821 RepID=A0AA86DYN8_SULMK|nr:DNA/RNA non-specific endonuclease [Sulfurospirillum multivorans]AHJ11845.1 putative nuclease [Sulfurospirillum multivorans DSM 12446]QEH05351.1 putative nuclease [Sulfurospirillum multivorans]